MIQKLLTRAANVLPAGELQDDTLSFEVWDEENNTDGTLQFAIYDGKLHGWEAAGWCLEQMQGVWCDGTTTFPHRTMTLLSEAVAYVSVERVLMAYVEWREHVRFVGGDDPT